MPRALSVLGLVVAAPIFSTGVGVTLILALVEVISDQAYSCVLECFFDLQTNLPWELY